ncbi:MAG: DNA repair protein RecN [Tenericutes bacterium GWF2_57_13]|nr:MAG: DNA repair protein RecN [Tenericutes bacterium GWF2_57_13]
MLETLSVRNFAIIDHIDLSFDAGMTVLTGETGAGKSLIIDAISLIAGERANSEMIRSGADKAEIVAVFSAGGDRLAAILDKYRIESPGGKINIRREITAKGNNPIRVNDTVVTLAQLKEIAARMIDVHTQFDSQRLIDPANYLDLIDGFKPDVTARYRLAYLAALATYHASLGAFRDLVKAKDELAGRLDLYRHQLDELDRFGLDPDEPKKLLEERDLLANFDKIDASLREAKRLFDETALLENLYDAGSELERLASFGEAFARRKERVRDAYYELDDIKNELDKALRELDFDATRFTAVETRLAAIEELCRKYKKTIPELVDLRSERAAAIDRNDNFDEYLDKARAARDVAFVDAASRAAELTTVRREIAKRIETELMVVFGELCLPGTRFSIVFSGDAPTDPDHADVFLETGVDRVDFLISTNLGEPPKPLSKTASGGEMSRVMLAFKTIFVKSQDLSAIVFDEIDTGISGIVAKQIARKIKSVSAACQVIAISHVPQVVAAGDRQIHVTKRETKGRTVADAATLSFEERVTTIAEMLSGMKGSAAGIASAQELLLNM